MAANAPLWSMTFGKSKMQPDKSKPAPDDDMTGAELHSLCDGNLFSSLAPAKRHFCDRARSLIDGMYDMEMKR
jgi:hypothetical protein